MSNSEYESLLKKMLEQRPDLSQTYIENKIKEKKEKIGAGYLTNQGALILIASDLGISLYQFPTSKTPQKTEIVKQDVSVRDLDRKYSNLARDFKNNALLRSITSVLLLVVILGVLILVMRYPLSYDNAFVISLIIIVPTFSISIAILIVKARKLSHGKKDRLFLKIFDVHQKLQIFLDSQNDKNNDKAQESISDLADYVEGWTTYSAPKSISNLPESIGTNLRKKALPLVKTKSIQEIKNLKALIFTFASTYNEEPTLENLSSFNYALDAFPKITEVEKKSEGIFSKKPLLKPITIGTIFWIIFFSVLLSFGVNVGQALGFSVASSIGLITFLRHEFAKNKS